MAIQICWYCTKSRNLHCQHDASSLHCLP